MTATRVRVTTALAISGTTCGHCVQHVESELAGVTARVDPAGGTAEGRPAVT